MHRAIWRALAGLADDPLRTLLPALLALFVDGLLVVALARLGPTPERLAVAAVVRLVARAPFRSAWIAGAFAGVGWVGRPLPLLAVEVVTLGVGAAVGVVVGGPFALGALLLAQRGDVVLATWIGALGVTLAAAGWTIVRAWLALAAPDVIFGGRSAVGALWSQVGGGRQGLGPRALWLLGCDLLDAAGFLVGGASWVASYPLRDQAVAHEWAARGAAR